MFYFVLLLCVSEYVYVCTYRRSEVSFGTVLQVLSPWLCAHRAGQAGQGLGDLPVSVSPAWGLRVHTTRHGFGGLIEVPMLV